MARAKTEDIILQERVLLTDFPSVTAIALTREILSSESRARVYLLTAPSDEANAQAALKSFSEENQNRIEILVGAAKHMDLGLSGHEYKSLQKEITSIHHLSPSAPWTRSKEIDIDATKQVFEFAADLERLRRVCHWSTVFVSGKREGVIQESELREGQSFNSAFEENMFRCEVLAESAKAKVPTTVFRPSIILPGTVPGPDNNETDKEVLAKTLRFFGARASRRSTPVSAVPLDYVVKSAYALSTEESAAGQTFHLVTRAPISIRMLQEIFDRIPNSGRRTKRPVELAKGLLKPGGRNAFYCDRGARETLSKNGIKCPELPSYLAYLEEVVTDDQFASTDAHNVYAPKP